MARLGKVINPSHALHASPRRACCTLNQWLLIANLPACDATTQAPKDDVETAVEKEDQPQSVPGAGSDSEASPSRDDAPSGMVPAATRGKESLLNAAARARRGQVEETEHEKILREEEDILHHITQKTALQAVGERAKVSNSSFRNNDQIVVGNPVCSCYKICFDNSCRFP